jgi:hypothetical protein
MPSIGTVVVGVNDVRRAERVDWDLYPDDAVFAVLADTEGNRFCVIDTGRG